MKYRLSITHSKPSAVDDVLDHEGRDQSLFDRIAAKYSRKDLFFPSTIARRHRVLQTIRAVPYIANARILELGCGAGYASEYLDGHFSTYCGVDYSSSLITYAESRHGRPNVEFVSANIKTYEPTQPFTLIFAIGVLHHMEDLDGVLKHVQEMLQPGGWLVVNEPSPSNRLVSFARRVRKMVDSSYSSDQAELRKSHLTSSFQHAGLCDIRVRSQGLLSTPFAEVTIPPAFLMTPAARFACWFDTLAEAWAARLLQPLAWNIIIAGQRPELRKTTSIADSEL